MSYITFITICIFSINLTKASITESSSEEFYPTSCKNLNETFKRDIVQIQVNINKKPFYVKCNHRFENGGWIIVLHRDNGIQDFNCAWKDCVRGFGNINGDFFIGLERLHDITSHTLHELMFILENFENETKTAKYSYFAIEDKNNDYLLCLLGYYSGDAGDAFSRKAGTKFASKDKDQTNFCAYKRIAPGWFNSCSDSNIFGKYLMGSYEDDNESIYFGLHWTSSKGINYALKSITMMIRPIN